MLIRGVVKFSARNSPGINFRKVGNYATGIFRFKTGVTCGARRRSRRRVDDVLASVRSASVLGSACTGDSDVPSAIFPHAVVANIPYILPIIPELFLVFLLPNYSRSRGYSRIFFRLFRNYSLVFLLPIIPKLFLE